MNRFNDVNRSTKINEGFTLIETAIVIIVVGVLASLSTPSLINFHQKVQLENALIKLRGAIRETQSEAIRLNRSCSVVISPGVHQSITGNCLLTGDRTFKGIQIQHNQRDASSPWSITFDHKGRNQSFDDKGTAILHFPMPSQLPPKCLVMSIGIGLNRVGEYQGELDHIVARSCITT